VMVWMGTSSWKNHVFHFSEVMLFIILGFWALEPQESGFPLPSLVRWLDTVKVLKVKFTEASQTDCIWRRLQVHEQQSERQRKNVLQKVLTFAARARQLECQDLVFKVYN